MIEWYDFYIFGSLAVVLSPKFFPPGNDTFAYISYLATFAVGFMVRPFGALFFGRIGDIVGRKYAFLVTLSIMGGATALIGFLPTYATIGLFAPIILLDYSRSARPCTWRRVWRRNGLRRGARTRRQARLLHQLHPDHGDAWPIRFLARHPRHATSHDTGGLQSMGLAHSVPRLHHSGNNFPLYPLLKMKESPIFTQRSKGRGHDFRSASERGLHKTGEFEARFDLAVRSNGRPGRYLVHGPVLRTPRFPANDSQS